MLEPQLLLLLQLEDTADVELCTALTAAVDTSSLLSGISSAMSVLSESSFSPNPRRTYLLWYRARSIL